MKFTIKHSYLKDTDTLFKVLTDKSYLMKKFEATGAKNIEILECGEKNGNFVITRRMGIPANPPGFAKKFIKAINTVSATDTWQSYDGKEKTGVFVVDIKGLPIDLTGTLTLKPTKKGCDYFIEFDAKTVIPIIGGKIIKIVENDTRANQEKDYQFTKTYLENM